MSELSDRLRDAKGDRSIDWIVEHAALAGQEIHRSVVAKYISGKHGPRPPEATLAALAAGLDLDVRELRQLAGRQPGELGPWVPPAESASLSQEVRDALDQLIRAIVSSAPSTAGSQAADPDPDQVDVILRAKGIDADRVTDPESSEGRTSRVTSLAEFMGSALAETPEDREDPEHEVSAGYRRTAARRGSKRAAEDGPAYIDQTIGQDEAGEENQDGPEDPA